MRRPVLLLLTLICAPAGRLPAQAVMPPMISVVGGQMRYSLADTRTDALVALRLASPLVSLGRRHWLIEPGMSYGWYRADDATRRHVFVGEIQLQFQAGPRAIQPYVGGGGGLTISRVDSTSINKFTASAAAGLRLNAAGWGIAGEIRIRALKLFQGTTRELTISLFRELE